MPDSYVLRDRAHRLRELVFAAESDADLNRRVGGGEVFGSANGYFSGCTDVFEFALKRRHCAGIQHAHVDGDALRAVVERPLEERFERLVCTLLQQVAFRDDDGDVTRRGGVVPPDAGREVLVVESHWDGVAAIDA